MLYGVWIKKTGWLRNGKGVFAAEDRAVAEDAAAFWHGRAMVKAIDESAPDFEQMFLEAEKVSRWAILIN